MTIKRAKTNKTELERENCSKTNIKKTIKKDIKMQKEKSYNNLNAKKKKEEEIIKETEEEAKRNVKRKKYEKNK